MFTVVRYQIVTCRNCQDKTPERLFQLEDYVKVTARFIVVFATSVLCIACTLPNANVGGAVSDSDKTSKVEELSPFPKTSELSEQQLSAYTSRSFKHEALPNAEEFSVHDTIVHLAKQGAPRLDLGNLRYYNERIKRGDLVALQKYGADHVEELVLEDLRLSDEDIEPVGKMKLTCLKLNRNPVKDLHALRDMQSLDNLHLDSTPVNATGWQVVTNLKKLRELTAKGTQISDADLMKFRSLKNLRLLELSNCENVTPAGISMLKQALPNCAISTTSILKVPGETGADDLKMVRRGLMHHRDFDEADLTLKKFIAGWEKNKNGRPAWFAEAYRLRGECQRSLGHYPEAKQLFLKCLDLSLKELPGDIMVPLAQAEYALVLEKEKDWKGALEWRHKADEFMEKHPVGGKDKLKIAENWNKMASDYEELGDEKKARQLIENAISLANAVGYNNSEELHRFKLHLRNMKAHKETIESNSE